MAERILLVEDEEKLARMVELELRYEGYEVEKAFDGRTGLERALSGSFDLVLLDIMLPQLSGMEVLRRLRRERSTSSIMADVLIALLPACVAAIWLFGLKAVWILLTANAACGAAPQRSIRCPVPSAPPPPQNMPCGCPAYSAIM